jgi:hypothetical protein
MIVEERAAQAAAVFDVAPVQQPAAGREEQRGRPAVSKVATEHARTVRCWRHGRQRHAGIAGARG